MTDADRIRAAGLRVTAAPPGGSPARAGSRAGGRHLLVCRGCGERVDASCAPAHAGCLEPAAAAGFAVEEAEVTFWGLCPRCRRSAGR